MPKQQVWRYKGGFMSNHKYRDADAPEISKWSSSSSDRSTGEGASNGTNGHESDSSNQPESPFDSTETVEERLERWKKFYSEKGMESYFDKDDYEDYLDDLLFDRLYHEVQHTVYETGAKKYRGQEQVRSFWDYVRTELRDDEETESPIDPIEELQHITASRYSENPLRNFRPRARVGAGVPGKDDFRTGKTCSRSPPPIAKSPTVKITGTGEDPDLLEIRKLLMNLKQ
jgi:hypothetical protein